MSHSPSFLLVTCQLGAEAALKAEVARLRPDFRLSYSRPGFVTFKLSGGLAPDGSFDFPSVFARAHCFSLGKASDAEDVARQAAVCGKAFTALHVWQRDTATPGWHDFEPGPTALAEEARKAIAARMPATSQAPSITPKGAVVLDCILVEPDEWWLGWHVADSLPSRVAGGMRDDRLPSHAVSRAYLKMDEALWWSRLPMADGDGWAEIGCAPGGAAQVLLERGARVLGVDPAEVHPDVAGHPNFRHLRRRGKEVQRKELRDVRFLAADMNVAPSYTLDTVEALVTHPKVAIDGLILTLKLPELELAENVPEWLERVRGWGFREVRARQLQHNRQEICVAALRSSAMRRKNAATNVSQVKRGLIDQGSKRRSR